MWRIRVGFWTVLLAIVAATVLSAADEGKPTNEDRAEFRTAQRLMRSKIVQQRVEGIERLGDLSAADAVKLLVPLALVDSAAEVRRAAYKTVLKWKDDREVGVVLLRALNKEARAKKKDTSAAVPLIAILLASEQPETEQEFSKFLDGYLATLHDAVPVLVAVADELGEQTSQQSLGSLQKMIKHKSVLSTFACRRAVVQAMILIHLPEAVEALIGLLPQVDGEVRADILRYLALLSGQSRGTDAKAWHTWWEKNKDSIKFPPVGKKFAATAQASPNAPSYYGLSIEARRMVFVIDISGSMDGPRLMAAKRELTHAISDLPQEASFSIVAFSNRAAVWSPKLMTASAGTKRAAVNYVLSLRAAGHTAAYDALEAAFHFDTEAVYFLSDGEPNAGKIPRAADILTSITKANRARRVSIYTIGIAPGQEGGPLDQFVKTLAEDNFGVYRRVDR
jgi:hypothetical protein